MSETLRMFNGNNQEITKDLPTIIICGEYNDVALAWIEKQTGLILQPHSMGYQAKPTNSGQIVKLFLTYNWKTKYYNNWNFENTILLKSDHHIGFDVDSICFDCVKKNRIHVGELKEGDRLSC